MEDFPLRTNSLLEKRVLVEKLTVAQILKNHAFYGTQRFVAESA
jgi:hypothetical protein